MDKRTLLALSLTFALLMFYQIIMTLYFPPPQEENVASSTPAQETPVAPRQDKTVGKVQVSKNEASKTSAPPPMAAPAIDFKSSLITSRISTAGGRVADLEFLKYLDKPKEGVPTRYFTDQRDRYFVSETGFMPLVSEPFPDSTTLWSIDASRTNAAQGQVTLTWDNSKGITFEKRFEFDPTSYLFKITDRVTNRSAAPAVFHHFAHMVRIEPEKEGAASTSSSEFTGPMGFLDGVRVQHAYEDLIKQEQFKDAKSGWIGFTDLYFLAAIVPAQEGSKKFYFDYDAPAYRVGALAPKVSLDAGTSEESSYQFYVGPKEHTTLELAKLDLDRSLDYGWFHFVAMPLLQLLLFFYKLIPNFGLAIILLTITVKILFFPLASKSYRSMNDMKKLQPKLEQLKKLHGDDKTTFNQEMMKLYQEHKVNPLGGCLPIVVQIPVFFALYKVLYLSIEMRHAPFIFWLNDLSDLDPYYILPLLMGASMFVQSKLNPTPADPMQAKMMAFLPLIFTVMFLQFPSGLVLYWLVNNVISIAQQAYIMKQNPA